MDALGGVPTETVVVRSSNLVPLPNLQVRLKHIMAEEFSEAQTPHNKRQTGARSLYRQTKFKDWLAIKSSLHSASATRIESFRRGESQRRFA
mgnify:CR=1 FL=1